MKKLEKEMLSKLIGGDRFCRQSRRALKNAISSGAEGYEVREAFAIYVDACNIDTSK